MGIKRVSDILREEKRKQTGVMCFECVNLEQIAWSVETAEERKCPVIVMLYYDMDFYTPVPVFLAMAKEIGKRAQVDVGILYDHVNTLKQAEYAVDQGFPSITFDASAEGYAANKELTRQIVEYAHARGADVTGYPGKEASLEEMVRFAAGTGVDAMIVPVIYEDEGNNHAFTQECHWFETNRAYIDFEKLQGIADAIDLPFVLHGAYNVSDQELVKALAYGVAKVDDGCPFDTRYFREMKRVIEAPETAASIFGCNIKVKDGLKEYIAERMLLLRG